MPTNPFKFPISILFNYRRKNFNLIFRKESTNTSRDLKNGCFLPLSVKPPNPLSSSELANLSSLISIPSKARPPVAFHPSSLKAICFGVRKISFHPPKDRVLHSKTRSFTTPNIYLSQKTAHPSSLFPHPFSRNIYVSLAKNAKKSRQKVLKNKVVI